MSGYQVNGTDLDTLFARYSDVYNTFSAGFTGVSYSNGVNTNIGTTTGYKTSNGYDLSQRYVELSKLGASLKKDDSVKYTGSTKYYIGNGSTDIGTLYVAFGKVQWSAAITAITSVALTNSNNVTFSFNFAGYPSKIDAYLTWPNNGTSTTNYGGSLPAIGQTAGGSGSFTVNSLPADTQISYQLRSYISGVDGPNMSYPSTASSFYTHPILSAPTSNSNGIVTSGDSTDYSYTLKGSPDVYQKAAVFTDSGLGNRYNSNEYKPGETITFKSMAPRSDSYTYYLAPYDRNTGNYNSGSDFVKALTFTIGVGSINYDTSTYSGGYQKTATSITVYLANIINVYSVTATANDVTGDTGGVPKGGTSAQKGSIAFACRPMTRYRISISGYYGDGSKYTFALTPFEVTTPSDVSITNIGATSTSTTITVSGTATNATSVRDSNGNVYSLDNNGAFTRDYAVASNTQQTYTVKASGTGGSDENTVSRYTLPTVSISTSATSYQVASGSSTVTVTLNVSGAFDKVRVYSDSNFSTLVGTSTSANSYSVDVAKGKDGSPYTYYAVPYDNTLSSPDYNTTLAASTSFSVTAGSIKPTGGPVPTVTNGWNIMYITSANISSYSTLTFSGAFNYQIIVVGAGGDGNSYKDGDVNNRQGGGGGGAGGVVVFQYTSSAGHQLVLRVQTGSYVEMQVNKVDNTPLGVTPLGVATAGFGFAGNISGDGGLSSSGAVKSVGSDGKYVYTTPSCFTSVSTYVVKSGGNGLPNNFGNQGGGGGGGGVTQDGYDGGQPGGLGNQGGAGGAGYTWSVDGVEYARGGPGGFIKGAGTLGLGVSTTAGSGGSGGSGGPSGIIRETTGQGYLFAIAWQ
jgi:hypothetical protein